MRLHMFIATVLPLLLAADTVHHRMQQQMHPAKTNSNVCSKTAVSVSSLDKQSIDEVTQMINASRQHSIVNESPNAADLLVPAWTLASGIVIVAVLFALNCFFLYKMTDAVNRVRRAKVRSVVSRKSSHVRKVSAKGTRSTSKAGCWAAAAAAPAAYDTTVQVNSSKRGSDDWELVSHKSTSSLEQYLPLLEVDQSSQSIIEDGDEVPTVMRCALAERSLDRRIERPMTEEEFMQAMKKVIEFIVELYRNPAKHPVSTDIRPNDIYNTLPQQAPENPEGFDLVWTDFYEIIFKKGIQWQHPRFHSFFPCGRSYPDILAETLISSLGNVGFNWSCNPSLAELDLLMVNWMGRALGIPEHFLFQGSDTCESPGGGWIADTASDTIFCAVMAARHIKVQQELRKLKENTFDSRWKHEKTSEISAKLVAYGSYESHSSFEKACLMAGVYCRHVEVYEEDDYGMRRAEVERMMEKDVEDGLIPFYLHCALGTTSTATSDHLEELTPLKEKYDVWIHVDAAYAGSAWIVPSYRNNAGLDKVDSMNVNLHKFFLISTSVTLFWTSRQAEYKECFRVHPVYLKKKAGGNDPRDWGIQLSRRFKSLKVYMLLRSYGINGMRAYVTRIIKMTEYMETFIVKIPNIRKFGKTHYGLFCVQYHEEGMSQEEVNAATNALWEFVNNSRKMLFTHSNVRGHDIIRVAVTLERSTERDVEESVEIFTQLVDKFRSSRAESAVCLAA